jgi:hypothetical protein
LFFAEDLFYLKEGKYLKYLHNTMMNAFATIYFHNYLRYNRLYQYKLSEPVYTDKKENQNFLIYKEIHKGSLAKSYMTNGLLIYCMVKYLRISSYIRKPFLIFDFATNHI